jgi:hypothetical protein
MTLEELIAQCKAENPTMTQTINGESFVLDAKEYNQAAHDWAVMRLAQIEYEKNPTPPKPFVFNEAALPTQPGGN